MDKFRVQIEAIKKYHFWILFGLVLVTSVAIWSIASADSSARYDKGTKRLKDVESKVTAIANNTKHPNAAVIAELQDLIGKVSKKNPGSLSNQVYAAWKSLYFAMRRENELPDIYNSKRGDAGDITLQKAFEARFDELWLPMEDIASLPTNGGFIDNDRDHYQNHIKEFFPTLLNLIEWRHLDTTEPTAAERAAAAPRSASGEEQKKMKGIVDWADANNVMTRFEQWKGSPTTLQIMIAQEDLWVYESMLKVIRSTNNASNGWDEKTVPYVSSGTHKAARVKRILAMEICQNAVANWLKADQSVIHLPDSSGGAGGAPAPKVDIRASGFSAGNTSGGISPLANRYVDENGKPLEDPLKQPFAEFRMMPIFMRVVIEQSGIPRLLAACANSSMRIDVTAVRMLGDSMQESPPPAPYEPAGPDAGAPGVPSPAPTGRPSPMGPMAMGGGRTGGGMPTPGRGGFNMLGGDIPADEDDASNPTFPPVIVEIQGIVYIYNKPKFSQLGKGSAAGGAATDATPATGTSDNDEPDVDPATVAPGANAAANSVAPPADSSKAPAAGIGAAPTGNVPATVAPAKGTATKGP